MWKRLEIESGRHAPAAALGLALALFGPTAPAQQAGDDPSGGNDEAGKAASAPAAKPARRTVEEFVVTAQKREQNVRDVPISMSVVNDEMIAEQGIIGFADLSTFVPNVKLRTDVASGINLNIRGFQKQSGNPAYDQAVGMMIDGVSYNANDFFLTGLLDTERVEVLRGPQGTLVGKNTTAGLLNVTTKDPTGEFGGYLDAQAGEFGRQRVEGAVGGPLVEGVVNYRVAAMDDQQDGSIDNTAGPDPLSRNRSAYRLKLEAPDLAGAEWGLQYEYADVRGIGNGTELLDIDQDSADYLRQFDPDLDIEPDNFTNSEDEPSLNDREIRKLVGRWGNNLGGWDIKAIAAYADVKGRVEVADGIPAPFSHNRFLTDKPQHSIDIVATSPLMWNGAVDFTGGLFYQQRDLDLANRLTLYDDVIIGLGTADDPTTSVVLPAPAPGAIATEASTVYFEQEVRSLAGYGQMSWYFAPRWTLTLGLRVTNERKEATWERVFNTANTVLLTNVLGWEEFTADHELDETMLQPKIALNFKPADTVSLFAHWARGFRSGGFNAAAGRDDGLEYDRETVDEYAINAKTRLLGGSLIFNLGLYRMELEDFQFLTTGPGDVSTVAVNAGAARAQGVEADFTWLPTDWLTVNGAVSYNDAEFTDFEAGPCANDRPNTDGDSDPRCDRTGDELPFAPDWTATLSPVGQWPITSALDLQSGFTVLYESEHTTGVPGDDRFTQDSYYKLNAFIGVKHPRAGWTLRIRGDNLTDESVNRATSQIATTDNFLQTVEPPRQIYAKFRWEFL